MTDLRYLADMQRLEDEASVTGIRALEDGRTAVVLEATLLYPQGGGQPADHGRLESDGGSWTVTDCRFVDGEVLHIGAEPPPFPVGARVRLRVDAARRALHSRLHSAGHVVDLAVRRLGMAWVPGKGYHFPDGPYVEYAGELPEARDALRTALDAACAALLAEDREVTVRFMPKEEMPSVCLFVPEELPAGKPGRVVLYGADGIPCGGTHVARLGEIGAVTIRKIRPERGGIRVGYDIARA